MTSHDQQDSHPTHEADRPQGSSDETPSNTITLRLRQRTVSFPGQRVTGIPDLYGNPALPDEEVYLTAKGHVAVYDPNRLTLSVHDLDDFVDTYLTTPVSWIVEDVLAAAPRPMELLDI
jgi:hypothetical protein